MFEQQHKLETFLMKDLIAMLSLVVQLPPSQRRKRRRIENLLTKFPKEMEVVERDIRDSIDHDLNVKMRAATEKFKINKRRLKALILSFKAFFISCYFALTVA